MCFFDITTRLSDDNLVKGFLVLATCFLFHVIFYMTATKTLTGGGGKIFLSIYFRDPIRDTVRDSIRGPIDHLIRDPIYCPNSNSIRDPIQLALITVNEKTYVESSRT